MSEKIEFECEALAHNVGLIHLGGPIPTGRYAVVMTPVEPEPEPKPSGTVEMSEMRLIIEHGNTKRRIEGPFNICGSGRDLEWIAECIQKRLTQSRGYGWVSIPLRPGAQVPIANTAPIPWDCPGIRMMADPRDAVLTISHEEVECTDDMIEMARAADRVNQANGLEPPWGPPLWRPPVDMYKGKPFDDLTLEETEEALACLRDWNKGTP